jgi:hypothetical protein
MITTPSTPNTPDVSPGSTKAFSLPVHKPAVTRAALDAFEHQSGLQDVARFLIETGRVAVIDEPGRSAAQALIARSNRTNEGNIHAAVVSQ